MGLRLLKQEEADLWAEKAEKYLPKSRPIHSFLSVGLRKNLFDLTEMNFYVPSNDSSPLFMIITGVTGRKDLPSYIPFWDPSEYRDETVVDLLTSLPGWNWQKPMFFYIGYLPALRQIEKLVLQPNGLGGGKLKLKPVSREQEGFSFVLNTVDLNKLSYPTDNYVLDVLTMDHADYIFDNYIYKEYYGVDMVKSALRAMPTMAAYKKQPDYKSFKPVSWSLTKTDGEIGMTHTMPEHRGQGLGGAVTLKLAEVLLKQNVTPLVFIVKNNPLSIKLHEKLGFVKEEKGAIGYHIYIQSSES